VLIGCSELLTQLLLRARGAAIGWARFGGLQLYRTATPAGAEFALVRLFMRICSLLCVAETKGATVPAEAAVVLMTALSA
jgi:hypothetical protein